MRDTDPPRFLLITPPEGDFDDIRQHITSSLQEVGIDPIFLNGDTTIRGYSIDDSIRVRNAIERADVIIVDITGNNPDVMFDTGYAIARGKDVLPIVQRKIKRVPASIGGRFYLVYDPSEPAQLSDKVKFYTLSQLEHRKE
jgi:hypothetical protein